MSGYRWRDPARWHRVYACLSGPECGLCMTRERQPEPLSPWEWRRMWGPTQEEQRQRRTALGMLVGPMIGPRGSYRTAHNGQQ